MANEQRQKRLTSETQLTEKTYISRILTECRQYEITKENPLHSITTRHYWVANRNNK